MSIRLYNSMSGQKENFETLEQGKVRFYACGPTVYNRFHLGNARMFVVFDTVRRYLEYRGYEVRYVQNFTDVDDKIIARANELGEDVRYVADHYIATYFEDADALGVRRATVHPRVTECIPDVIRFIEDLVDRGYAYERGGTVYFDCSKDAGYGKLSHQSLEDLRAGFRIEVNEDKDDPCDFALWKAAKPHEESWDSPWGKGRPGWHIECSVMNEKYLGDQIDIHGGGRDLLFPHHENEIAQSEAHSGHEFARYWMHNGTLNINGEKMSKSLGNFIMTHDLLERRSPRTIRYFLLSAQYRHPLNYTEEGMDQAEQSLDRIDRCFRNLDHRRESILTLPDFLQSGQPDAVDTETQKAIEACRDAFVEAMNDDFNTADGLAAVFEGVRVANTYLAQSTPTLVGIDAWHSLLVELLNVLGLIFDQGGNEEVRAGDVSAHRAGADADIEAKIQARQDARKRRDFQTADRIRDELEASGIIIEDTPQGVRWFRK